VDKPIVNRQSWHYVDYDAFTEGTRASALPPLKFAAWAPPAVIDEARKLYAETINAKDPAEAIDLLEKLLSDSRMKFVWRELYRKKRVNYQATNEFINPIYVTNASIAAPLRERATELLKNNKKSQIGNILQAEATWLMKEETDLAELGQHQWTEQDIGAQLFIWHVYNAARNVKPVLLSDIKADVTSLQQCAQQLRALAAKLKKLEIECAALEEIASECEDEARCRDCDPKTDDPWILTRQRNDIELRALVADLSVRTYSLCRKMMCGTIANIANVVLDRQDVTVRKVREMLRSTPGD
jgi:hypothetical protein